MFHVFLIQSFRKKKIPTPTVITEVSYIESWPVKAKSMKIQKINYRAILYSIDYVTYRPANNKT